MAHLEELTSYKERLMKTICQSTDIVELLKLPKESSLAGRDLRYVRIFPYDHDPDVNDDAGTFLCFDVDSPSTVSGIIKNVSIYFWVFTHQSLMRTSNGVRIDVLASAIDRLLNGSADYGLGKLELISCTRFKPCIGYHGRQIRYSVPDFNRTLCGS